jgi:hypothetical protein
VAQLNLSPRIITIRLFLSNWNAPCGIIQEDELMAFPFELYCKQCGSRILSLTANVDIADMLQVFRGEASVDSWVSSQIRAHQTSCPGCGRILRADPLIRADVMFSEWSDDSDEKAKSVIFYI